ncbi:MAG: aminoglycoside phosphotransferase family protein [Ruminococcaceae bacterium]|nr:aminoglycoside phosphotransferase family protein [Oscillospiraceae bacterium]
MFETLRFVGEQFRLPGTLYSYETITLGNINSTYKATYRNDKYDLKSYLFQRVNTVVFKNPVEIMANIDRVTSFIREKYPNQLTLHFHHTADGANYFINEQNYFWRVSNYVDSITFDSTDDLAVIAATGEAFGHFQMQLSDFDGSTLCETIPDFHNTKKRLDTLFADAEKDVCGRAAEVEEELEYIRSVREEASELSIRMANGELPTRVTHNDTKANNVLFDRVTKRPILVIDLDTVMPGMAMYDFGDAVRFIASTAVEDEPDLSKVFFDTAKFRAFAKGFIQEVKSALTAEEIDALVQASFSITIELAARFLDDYLNGDTYFKCNYPAHNLVRTRCQLQLAKDIHRKYDELRWIISDIMAH